MSSDLTMTNAQLGSVLLVVAAIIVGQILFKVSSQHVVVDKGPVGLFMSLMSWQFLLALVFYAIGTFLWVVVLKYVPLNRAYPFMAISFIVLPVAGYFLFGEPLTIRYMIGLVIFVTGLYLVVTS